MGQTEKYNLPYPSEDDYLKDTAEFIKNLAESTETTMETLENNKLDKTSKATSTEAIAGTNNTKYTTPYSVKSAIDKALEGYTPSDGGSGGDTLPIGAILPFSGDVIPNGWLLCDGSVIEQEDYPELFEVLAGKYGIISREEIRLPDLRGKVTVGKDSTDADFDTLGNTGGEKTHNLTIDELPLDSFNSTGNSSGSWTFVGVSSPVPHNNLQPYIVTNYIIKAKMTIVTVGEVIQENDTATTENVYSASAVNNKIKTNIVTGQEFATNEYIDNKQVFLTAFKFTSLLDSMVINSNIDYIKAIHCNIKDNSSGNWRTIPWIYNSSTYDSSFAGGIYVSSSGAIGFQAGTGLANISKGYVEVYYTKN